MGFSKRSLDFLYDNRFFDDKEWHKEHRDEYVDYVVKPFAEFIEELTPTMNSIDDRIICNPRKISRIYRDTRFHPTSIFRDNVWCTFKYDDSLYNGAPCFYFEISPRGYQYGCGFYKASTDTMNHMRELIVDKDKSFLEALKAYNKQDSFELVGENYKRDHYPNEKPEYSNWLNRKDICLIHDSKDFDLLFSDELGKRVAEDFRSIEPIYKFFVKANSK